jgi:hypothetical protein
MCVSVQNGVLMLMGIMKLLQSDYTIGLLNPKDTYSTDLIRTKFTRDIATTFKMACDELLIAVDDLIPATEMVRRRILLVEVIQYLTQYAEWVKVPFVETCRHVICCATNRVFVGAPLCP